MVCVHLNFDLLLKNCKIIIPKLGIIEGDIGIKGGKISSLSRSIEKSSANKIINVNNKIVFPGVIDAHSHIGIYRPFNQDAISESKAAVTGGITTILSYFRTGTHYLNISGPYREVYKKVLELSEHSFITDYGFHLAPMNAEHLNEINTLVKDFGVSSFKYFLSYRGIELKGDYFKRGAVEEKSLVRKETYDLGFLFILMKKIAELNREINNIRLSLHCEDPEIIRVSMEEAKKNFEEGKISPLEAYNRARPPLSEALAIAQAITLANYTDCPINILHITSQMALETASKLLKAYNTADVSLEVVIAYLVLTTDIKADTLAKINPPIRRKDDVEALWNGIENGWIDIVGSDNATVQIENKRGDIWSALPGFGENCLLLPILISEGYHKRKLPLTRVAELVAYNPSKVYGLYPRKGTLTLGSDADFAIVDLNKKERVTPDILNSAQEFTPFEGMEVKGWPVMTIIRGEIVFEEGNVIGKPGFGKYVKRPVEFHERS